MIENKNITKNIHFYKLALGIPFLWPLCLRINKCLCINMYSWITGNRKIYCAGDMHILRDEQPHGVMHLFLLLLSYIIIFHIYIYIFYSYKRINKTRRGNIYVGRHPRLKSHQADVAFFISTWFIVWYNDNDHENI